MSDSVHIAVFCRPLVAGQVKTRLIANYGEAGATQIYQRMVERTLTTVRTTCDAINATASLWVAGDCAHPSIVEWSQRFELSVHAQSTGDLGVRMFDCLIHSKLRAHNAILIGTDCPAFTAEHITMAATLLRNETPWVFTPAEDGGYVLVGSNAPTAAPFENIDWSTARVMDQTRAALKRAALSHAELPTLWDVDLPEDVSRAQFENFLEDFV
jgi:uncharacterized protein